MQTDLKHNTKYACVYTRYVYVVIWANTTIINSKLCLNLAKYCVYDYLDDMLFLGVIFTPQKNWRTNAINYNIGAFCVEHILKTNFTI